MIANGWMRVYTLNIYVFHSTGSHPPNGTGSLLWALYNDNTGNSLGDTAY